MKLPTHKEAHFRYLCTNYAASSSEYLFKVLDTTLFFEAPPVHIWSSSDVVCRESNILICRFHIYAAETLLRRPDWWHMLPESPWKPVNFNDCQNNFRQQHSAYYSSFCLGNFTSVFSTRTQNMGFETVKKVQLICIFTFSPVYINTH